MRLANWAYSLPMKLRALLRATQVKRELDDELRYHVESKTEEYIAKGLSPTEARRTVLIELGGIGQTKEACSDASGASWMQDLVQDLRYGLRILGKSPGFTAVAILTLALGIGANVAIFTIVNDVLLRPLPYPEAERIVQVDRQFRDGPYYGMSLIQFRGYQHRNRAFQQLAAYDMLGSGLNFTAGADPELIQSRRVSADFFRVLGTPPARGRDFSAEDDRPGAAPVVILSDRVARTLLGAGDPIGKPIRLGGENYTVIGITPCNFSFLGDTEAWIPLRLAEDPSDHASAFEVFGRLNPNVSRDIAQQDLNEINAQIRHDYPGVIEANEVGTNVNPYQQRVVGDTRSVLLLLAVAVACVLLVACSNIAGLLLARAVGRRKEVALRFALGVTPARLIRQLLTESLLLAVAGGIAGLFLARSGIRGFMAVAAASLPNLAVVRMDVRVLLFGLGLSIFTGILFGVAPALQLGQLRNSSQALCEAARTTASGATRRLQGLLVSLEICLTTILLIGAGLLVSSLTGLLRVNPGFDPRHVLTVKTSFVDPAFDASARDDALARKAIDRLQALPGVQAAAASSLLPTEASLQDTLEIPTLPSSERPAADSDVQWRAITSAYFQVLQIPVLEGRAFDERDSPTAAPVAIVNRAFVHKYFADSNGLDQEVLLGRKLGPQFADRPRQIVGVVADSRELGLDNPVAPAVFIPLGQVPDSMASFLNRLMPMNWLVRVSGDPLSFGYTVHREFLYVDPELVTSNPRSLAQVLRASLAQQRVETMLLGFFALAALLLGAIGLYGILAYSVAQRKQELGIRMALGADRRHILRLVASQALRLTLAGTMIGVAVSLVLTRLLSSLLFGVSAVDPFLCVAVVCLLVLVAFAACLIPVQRASRVDPAIVLRYE